MSTSLSLPNSYHVLTKTFCSFGLVATLLEMVPVASMFFTYTNTGMFQYGQPRESRLTIF